MAKVTFTDKDKTGVSPINKWRDSDDTIQLVVKSDNVADVTFINITTTIRPFSI